MALDPVPTYPGQYDAVESNNNPDGSETRREGDDQIRRMKASEKATWTNVTGAVTSSHEQLNRLADAPTTGKAVVLPDGNTTPMVFYRDTAPTGWTIVSAVDEHSLRLTQGSGLGGTSGGTSGGTYDFGVLFDNLAEGATPGVGDHLLTGSESGTSIHDHPQNSHRVLTEWTGGTGQNRERISRDIQTGTGNTPIYTRDSAFTLGNDWLDSQNTEDSTSANAAQAHGHSVDLRLKWAACIMASLD